MSYQIPPDALVPLLARCLVKHGSMEAIHAHIRDLERSGSGDATVTPEFIATNGISRRVDGDSMIAEAMALAEKAIHDANTTERTKVPALQAQRKTRKLPRILLGFFLSFLVTLGAQFRSSVDSARTLPLAEQIAYMIPGSLFISLHSPTFLQCLSYPEMFHQARRAKLDLGKPLDTGAAASANTEGFIWGLIQGVVFYLPLLIRRKVSPKTE
jgi:hypothetical protein